MEGLEPKNAVHLNAEHSQPMLSSELELKEQIVSPNNSSGDQVVPRSKRGFQFWAIIAALCVTSLLGSLENSVVVTSLPTIVRELDIGDNYIWVTNLFFVTGAAVQPFFGQMADIFGRRWLTLFIVSMFTLGSGICGGATNGSMLIAGRAIQGIGSGGLNMMIDVIISDLVPLRERGNFLAMVLSVYTIGASLGPWVGGAIVDHTSWRWVFYINLPVCAVSLTMLFFFLHVRTNTTTTFLQKIKRIDYIGNAILISSTVSILIALTYGGTRWSWSSPRTLISLIFGLLGLLLFIAFESSTFVLEPVTPPRLFQNQTSAIVFIVTFLNSVLLYWAIFFLPVYFQAVLLASPSRSGVQLLPVVLIAIPGAIVSALLLARFGKYKILHQLGFAICTVGLGLFSLLDGNSTTAEWVIYQAIAAWGSGFVFNTLLPACQAGLEEKDQAAATATWSFVRSFGSIWGVAIPAAIFNNKFEKESYKIEDPAARQLLAGGHAYEYVSAKFVASFEPVTRRQVVGVYTDSLRLVWRISVVFSGLAFILVLFERQIKMRTELETEFGLKERKTKREPVDGGYESKP